MSQTSGVIKRMRGYTYTAGTSQKRKIPCFSTARLSELLREVPAIVNQNVWFMHDDVPTHISIEVRNHLHSTYPGGWIVRGGSVAWPPHSTDLNPLDPFESKIVCVKLIAKASLPNHKICEIVSKFYKKDNKYKSNLNGYVNKQNCRIWSEANPQVYVETPLHPEKLTVWCALWAGEIIGPYFFKNDKGHNVTVKGDRYRAMITNFFIPELNNNDVQELWFQQDDATCHTARATIDLLKDTFGDRLISRFGPVNWPPRSCH
ncbi:uncharacterized protein TNCV_1156891 [Trichonephila clavipes]|nr:uncharacterized protein TNCV_1156891 [Trichonephila clavipes]